uniref:Uncharacterized protein n=3 Tax=Avena sativa TaxID=4498 RepID=A0ACD6AE04_AVESA
MNTGSGTPFINGLDLRPLKNKLYPLANETQALVLLHRLNLGPTDTSITISYPDDPYDRRWTPYVDATQQWGEISTDVEVPYNADNFEAPSAVMQTAITTRNVSDSIELTLDLGSFPADLLLGYIQVLHFAELKKLPSNSLRQFYIYRNGALQLSGLENAYTPGYLWNGDFYSDSPFQSSSSDYILTLNATPKSIMPPIINAIEIFSVISTALVGTDPNDVSAITEIKGDYQVSENWMGDPCIPTSVVWVGLTCSYAVSTPPIITSINMSFSALDGLLSSSFANLRNVQYLRNKKALKLKNERTTSTSTANVIYGDSSLRLENRRFTYNELDIITTNFQQVLGKGGFGYVYHGILEDGVQVAVKLRSHSSNQGVKEFIAEAQILTRIHHKNLVNMIGYCKDAEYMALVYEYMPEGNLREHIAGKDLNGGCLTWRQRLRIALESAQGLEYLHSGCNPPLIHRDVKTTNILLNTQLEAKIADFGLSKAFSVNNDAYVSTNTLVGTPGYVDPEYQATMQPSTKSDVYSFGVVLLELITGKPAILHDPEPISIIRWAQQRLARGDIEGVVDSRMGGDYDVNSVWKTAEIALKCTEQASLQRPSMTDLVVQLRECLELGEDRTGIDTNNKPAYTGVSSGANPYMGYKSYTTTWQSNDVSQTKTALDMEHSLRRMPSMDDGPAAR